MEAQLDALQGCLLERFSLGRERDRLVELEANSLNPRRYLDCIARLETVLCRISYLSSEIKRLTIELRAHAPDDDQPALDTPQNVAS